MKYKPIIGIVGRISEIENKNIIHVNEEYRLAITKAGGIPFIIIPSNDSIYNNQINRLTVQDKNNLLIILKFCDGILMPGGNVWYEFDEFICEFAINNDIPILGICLGMQILANMDNFCGTFESDKTVKNQTYINHCQRSLNYVHSIKIISKRLKKILKSDVVLVNSRHAYHIVDKDFFKVSAYSEDEVIEAIEFPNYRFVVGIQWHPESMISYEPIMLEIFKEFIKQSLQYHNSVSK